MENGERGRKKRLSFSHVAARRACYVTLIKRNERNCASMKNPCATSLRKRAFEAIVSDSSSPPPPPTPRLRARIFISRRLQLTFVITLGDRCKSNFRSIGQRVVVARDRRSSWTNVHYTERLKKRIILCGRKRVEKRESEILSLKSLLSRKSSLNVGRVYLNLS